MAGPTSVAWGGWTRRRFARALATAWVGASSCRRDAPREPIVVPRVETTAPLEHIAFGSCLKQDLPMPILADIVAANPELFLFIGDNVYAEGPDEASLRDAYDVLAKRSEYAALREAVPILAVWDDHDFGINDGGREHPHRDAAQKIMLEFFAEPTASPRWQRVGVYDSVVVGPVGRRVQIVMLDTRSFRDPLLPTIPGSYRYRPNDDPKATILGDAQWKWLEEQLRQPAELRLLVSTIQVIADEHPFESWSRFPHERKRLLELVGRTPNVIVLSGDRHRGELSRLDDGVPYPLFDLTSSSLNLPLHGDDPNRFRVGQVIEVANFGRVDIDWAGASVRLSLVVEGGAAAVTHDVPLAELQP